MFALYIMVPVLEVSNSAKKKRKRKEATNDTVIVYLFRGVSEIVKPSCNNYSDLFKFFFIILPFNVAIYSQTQAPVTRRCMTDSALSLLFHASV